MVTINCDSDKCDQEPTKDLSDFQSLLYIHFTAISSRGVESNRLTVSKKLMVTFPVCDGSNPIFINKCYRLGQNLRFILFLNNKLDPLDA